MANSQYDLDTTGGLMPVRFLGQSVCECSLSVNRFCVCSKFKLCLLHHHLMIFREKDAKRVWRYTLTIRDLEEVIIETAVIPAKRGENLFAVIPAQHHFTFSASKLAL